MEEGKFFFLGMAPREIRIESIRGYIESLSTERGKLLQIQSYVQNTRETAIKTNIERICEEEKLSEHLLEVSEEETLEKVVQNIYDYQIFSLEYGLKRLQDDIAFYEGILERELSRP